MDGPSGLETLFRGVSGVFPTPPDSFRNLFIFFRTFSLVLHGFVWISLLLREYSGTVGRRRQNHENPEIPNVVTFG